MVPASVKKVIQFQMESGPTVDVTQRGATTLIWIIQKRNNLNSEPDQNRL